MKATVIDTFRNVASPPLNPLYSMELINIIKFNIQVPSTVCTNLDLYTGMIDVYKRSAANINCRISKLIIGVADDVAVKEIKIAILSSNNVPKQ